MEYQRHLLISDKGVAENYKCIPTFGKKALKICSRFCNVLMVKIMSSLSTFPFSVVRVDVSV
jgi:hypothetical protein